MGMRGPAILLHPLVPGGYSLTFIPQHHVIDQRIQTYINEPNITYIEDPFIRKDMTLFRISANMLRIEKGRYKKIEGNNSMFNM